MLASQSTNDTNSVLVATWVTAGATIGLFVAACVTAFFALTAWFTQLGALVTQFMELSVLIRQAQADSHVHRRAQAAKVFIWLDTAEPSDDLVASRMMVYVTNSSQQPVYDVDVILPLGPEHIAHLMPEAQRTFQDIDTKVVDGTSMVSCTFRDAAGLRWLTTSTGGLTELDEPDPKAPDAEARMPDESAEPVSTH
jgi:hypothetical protein